MKLQFGNIEGDIRFFKMKVLEGQMSGSFGKGDWGRVGGWLEGMMMKPL